MGEFLINPQLTQQQLADKLEIGKRTVPRYMAMLQDKKVVVKEGIKCIGV